MDLASGIVGIVGVGIQICATLYKIGEAATSAGDEIPELIGHIEFTNSILNTVQKELQKAEVKAIIDSSAEESVRNAISKCQVVYKSLERFFDKQIRKFDDGSLEVRSSAKLLWFLREENFELQRQKLVSLKLDILMLMNVFQISVSYRSSNAGMSSQHMITYDSSGHQDAIEDGKQKLLDLVKRQKESEQRIALLEARKASQALTRRERSQLKITSVSPHDSRSSSRSSIILPSSGKKKNYRTRWIRRIKIRLPIRRSKVKTKKLSSNVSIIEPPGQQSLRVSLVRLLRHRSAASKTSVARSVEDPQPELVVLAETETSTNQPNPIIHGPATPRTESVVEKAEAVRDADSQSGAVSFTRHSSDESITKSKIASQPELESGNEITTDALQAITEQIQKLEIIVEETNKKVQATALALKAESEKKRAADADLQREASRFDTLEAKMKALESSVDKKSPKQRVRFQDYVGRKFDFPWQLVNTWEGIEKLVKMVSEQTYVHVPDSLRSQATSGKYNILGPEEQIILPHLWELLVEPDWHLSMQLWPLPGKTETGETVTNREQKSKKKHKREPHEEARRRSSGEVIVNSDLANLPDIPAVAETARNPIYPRIHKKYLDLETLEHYQLPWVLDSSNNDYLIILRELDKYETDVLFEHTRRMRMSQPSLKEPRYAWVRGRRAAKDLDDRQHMGAVDRPERSFKTADDDEAVASLVLKYTNLEEFEGYERGHHNSQLAVRKADIGSRKGERHTATI